MSIKGFMFGLDARAALRPDFTVVLPYVMNRDFSAE
jgi:hypothetical protein